MNFIKLIFMVVIAIAATNATAQEKSKKTVGANLAYGTDGDFSNFGIGAKFRWNVIDEVRLEPSFTCFLKKEYGNWDSDVSMWDLSLNVHYLYPLSKEITLYPLGGLGILGAGFEDEDGSESDTALALNIGGGVDFKLTDKFILDVRMKYMTANAGIGVSSDDIKNGRLIVSVGLNFRL